MADGTVPRTLERATREAVIAARAMLDSMRAHGLSLPAKDLTPRHSGQLAFACPVRYTSV